MWVRFLHFVLKETLIDKIKNFCYNIYRKYERNKKVKVKNSTRLDKNFRLTNALEAFNTETKEERVRREKRFSNFIRNTQTPSFAKLKKEADELYDKKVAEDESILAAADAGKLKSERLKKKAEILKAKREKENAKKEQEQEQCSSTPTK